MLYKTNMYIDNFGNSEDGFNKKRFEGRVDIQVQLLPYGYTGATTSLEVDSTVVPYRSIEYRKDKSLSPNIAYGTNTDTKMISDTLLITFPLTTNSEIGTLFSDVLSSTYNKSYTLKMDYRRSN